MPACLAAADIGVAPFDVTAHPPLQLAFYWSPLKVFEYMAAGLPVVAPAIPRLARILGPGHERFLYDAQSPHALADALADLADHDGERRRLGAAAARRVRRVQLGRALPEARRRNPPGDAAAEPVMRILVATDAFPPVCGGSGWSTYELARGLRERGHEVSVAQAHAGAPAERGRSYDGFRVRAIEQPAPSAPFIGNYFRNERLWARAAPELRAIASGMRADIIHAQHVLTSPAAVAAGAAIGTPVVCTVRDYWPVCYWGTLIHDPASPTLCRRARRR